MSNLEPITPKRFIKVPEFVAGIILVKPHGTLIMKGEKSLVVKSKKFVEYIDQPLLLIEEKKALGVIRLDEPREITQGEFKDLEEYHRITDKEAEEWSFSQKSKLYAYKVSVLEKYYQPPKVDYPTGAQVFVKPENIKFKLSKIQTAYIHAYAHSLQDLEEAIPIHNLALNHYLDYGWVHVLIERSPLDREELIFDIGKYDPSKSGNKPLADDRRIVAAWYSSLKKGQKITVQENGKAINLTLDKAVDLQAKIIKEIIKRVKEGRMKYTFRPRELKPAARELYDKVKKKLLREGITIPEELSLVDITLEQIDPKFLAGLTDKELKEIHGWLHYRFEREKGEVRTIEPYVNAHIFIQLEMIKRGILHESIDDLDKHSDKIILEYPKPPKELTEESDYIYLEDVVKHFPPTICLRGSTTHPSENVYLVGRIVNEGKIPRDHDIDLLFHRTYPDERILHQLEEALPSWLFKKLHFVYSPKGPMVGKSRLLYRPGYFKAEQASELLAVTIKVGKPFRGQKPGEGYNKYEFFDEDSLWKNWASERIEEGILIQKKADGMRFQIHKEGNDLKIFTEDKLRDRAKFFPKAVKEFLSRAKCDECIIDAEMVEYPETCKEKTAREMELKCEPLQREDMIKWVVAEKALDDSYIVFFCHDIYWLDGKNLTDLGYLDRFNTLKKIIPSGLKYWKPMVSELVETKEEFEEVLHKMRNFPGSEGALLKEVDARAMISYTRSPRNPGFSKIKNVKECDVIVLGVTRTKAGTYKYLSGFGPLTKEEENKYSPRYIREFKGKKYLVVGETYVTDIRAKEGDIITVSPIRIRFYKDKEGKPYPTWMFPIFRMKRPDKDRPDPVSVAEEIAKAGTGTLSKRPKLIKLDRCPFFDNPDICPLYPLYSEEWREAERRRREKLGLKIDEEYLRFPVKCRLAFRYKCPYVKSYYYSTREIDIENIKELTEEEEEELLDV